MGRSVGFSAGHFDRAAGALPTFRPEASGSIELVKGWFEDTLPGFLQSRPAVPVSLLHLDSDVYSAAAFVLRYLLSQERIGPGCGARPRRLCTPVCNRPRAYRRATHKAQLGPADSAHLLQLLQCTNFP